MSLGVSIQEVLNADYVILKKSDLMDLLVQVNMQTKVDARKKYISKKEAIAKYNLTRYWFEVAENDVDSLLRIQYGKYKNSAKKYNEQSIIDEQERLAGI